MRKPLQNTKQTEKRALKEQNKARRNEKKRKNTKGDDDLTGVGGVACEGAV